MRQTDTNAYTMYRAVGNARDFHETMLNYRGLKEVDSFRFWILQCNDPLATPKKCQGTPETDAFQCTSPHALTVAPTASRKSRQVQLAWRKAWRLDYARIFRHWHSSPQYVLTFSNEILCFSFKRNDMK